MNADGTGERRLTRDAAVDEWPTWSPDGGRIAFTRGVSSSRSEIYVMKADGSGQTQVTNGRDAWCASWR